MSTVARKYGRTPIPVRERILANIVVTESGCWEWQNFRDNGYGRIWVGSRTDGSRRLTSSHRVAYEEFVGPIPDGMVIDHLCRNPPCCNPEHLEPVTQQVNVAVRGRGPVARQLRQTHCKRDHEFTPENTYMNKGKRYCVECMNLRRKGLI